jgi:hypothetical protein
MNLQLRFWRGEYPDTNSIYGFCNCNANTTVDDFQNEKFPIYVCFSTVRRQLRLSGSFRGVLCAECPADGTWHKRRTLFRWHSSFHVFVLEEFLPAFYMLCTKVWQTLQNEGMYSFHIQWIHHFEPRGSGQPVEILLLVFCTSALVALHFIHWRGSVYPRWNQQYKKLLFLVGLRKFIRNNNK